MGFLDNAKKMANKESLMKLKDQAQAKIDEKQGKLNSSQREAADEAARKQAQQGDDPSRT